MAYWLFKTEPGAWSWDDQKKAGARGGEWDGVRNFQARANMKAMKTGDLGFFYHSVDAKSIVGVVKIVKEAHLDSTDATGVWTCVDVAAVADMPEPVTLAAIKEEPSLAAMVLARNARLSVQPVSEHEWQIVCRMGGLVPPPTSA